MCTLHKPYKKSRCDEKAFKEWNYKTQIDLEFWCFYIVPFSNTRNCCFSLKPLVIFNVIHSLSTRIFDVIVFQWQTNSSVDLWVQMMNDSILEGQFLCIRNVFHRQRPEGSELCFHFRADDMNFKLKRSVKFNFCFFLSCLPAILVLFPVQYKPPDVRAK